MTTPLHADLSDALRVVDAMREYIEQEVEPGLDILARWADRIHVACTHGAALLEAAGREDGKLTRAQALAVMGFTGIATVRFDEFHADVEKRLGGPIWTHQFPSRKDEIAALYRDDFMAMLPEWTAAPSEASA